jgi:hypothetical protein
MNGKKWIKVWVVVIMIVPILGVFNYLIDPYELYDAKYFTFEKKVEHKMRLIKSIKLKKIKPASITLGTSRTEGGYDPTHQYFIKPSYNSALPGSSIYESRLLFEEALKQGNLRKVLLVADFIMFSGLRDPAGDIETYFKDTNIYSYLFSIDMTKSSLLTIKGLNTPYIRYFANGQRAHEYLYGKDLIFPGHQELFNNEAKGIYNKHNNTDNYTYINTDLNSFEDFKKIVEQCYENNIELDIIFGPSHILLWEAFDYKKSFNQWLQWKKDIVISVNNIAEKQNKEQFKIMDFSVYHNLTSEKVPTDKNIKMKYYWNSGHYQNALGLIVLDRLIGKSEWNDFGVELNLHNIDEHLKRQKINRYKFINVEKYKHELTNYITTSLMN